MPTQFTEIYERAVFKFKDYSFLEDSFETKSGVLQHFLLSSIVDFQNACDVDLSDYDLENNCFNVDLTDEIKEILSYGVVFHWLSAQTLNSKLLKNIIHSSDYTSYSPGNLLNVIQTLRDTVEWEYIGKINSYSFMHGTIEDLKV